MLLRIYLIRNKTQYKGIMILSLIIILTMATSLFAENNDEEVCESPRCHYAATKFLESINNSIDPCEDFYSHVCFGWSKINKIRPLYNKWNWQKVLTENVKHHLTVAILEFHNGTSRPLSKAEKMLQNFYYTCIKAGTRIESTVIGIGTLNLLARIGGFPLLGIPLVNGYQWQDSLATVKKKLNLNGVILSLHMLIDVESFESNMVYMLQPSEDFFEEKIATVEEVLGYLALFNRSHKSESSIRESIEAMSDFETSLRMIMDNGKDGEHADKFYKATTVRELHQLMGDKVDIMRYLKNSFDGNADIRDDTKIIVPYFKMKNIRKVLEEVKEETIANFIAFSVLKKLLNAAGIFFNTENDQYEIKSRKYCLNTLIQYFPLAIAHAYSNIYHLKTPQKDELKGIFLEVKEAYKDIINRTEWMDNVTKFTALKKIQKISGNFFGPEMIQNETLLLDYYSMNTPNINFLLSLISLFKLKDEEEKNYARNRLNKSLLWPKIITEVTAVHDANTNSIFIPMAIAMFPYFLRGLPPVVNFGSIGTIIGHEITHTFQGKSRNIDDNGNFTKWWTNTTTVKYDEKLKCILKQYSNYSDPSTGIELDASRTLLEDFADNAGLKVAYLAYKRYMKNCTGYCSLRLPGLNYTADQLFFVAYAFIGCSYYRSFIAKDLYQKREHSPFRIRTSATLKNSEEFSKAFGCSSNSKINSEEKCPIW